MERVKQEETLRKLAWEISNALLVYQNPHGIIRNTLVKTAGTFRIVTKEGDVFEAIITPMDTTRGYTLHVPLAPLLWTALLGFLLLGGIYLW